MDQEVSQVLETEAKADPDHKPELSELSAYQWSDVGASFSTSSSIRERTIKLPETHIFTPVKGSSPIAREVTSRDLSPAPDDPYILKAPEDAFKGPIAVKEYHDVEYRLEPIKKIDHDNEFDDFQSAEPPPVILAPAPLLEPQRVESTEIRWPEPGKVAQPGEADLDFLGAQPAVLQSYELPAAFASLPIAEPQLEKPPEVLPKAFIEPQKAPSRGFTYSKPVIGVSPTEQNGSAEEDDFNDFQAAPPPMTPQHAKKLQSNDPITLSPARLVSSASSWISSFDNDEISRIEAAFPKCKNEKTKKEDEDDWSEFVGVPSISQSQEFKSPKNNGDADDWSDFVSVPPPAARNPSSRSSQLPSKPNFSSWNQPIAKPYVNHTTSFLSSDSGSQQFSSANYPYFASTKPPVPMTITNNFNYSFNQADFYHAPAANHPQKPNGISTILPELDFAMPKNLINLPRGADPGKK